QYSMVADSGGAGEYRGGLSVVRDIHILHGEGVLQVRSDRRKFMPWGLNGGKDGTPSWNIINPGQEERILPSKVNVPIREGDIFRHVTGGAGGHGNPLKRDPAAVADDVRNDKISRAVARDVYGVS